MWETGLTIIHDNKCPYIRRDYSLIVPLSLLYIAKLSDNIETEFIFYMKGFIDQEKRIVTVEEDYCIPKQYAMVASVEADPYTPCTGYNVVVHKHSKSVKHFSSIDDDYINSNNDVSILIENNDIQEAVVRIKLPCGAYAIVPVQKIYIKASDPENATHIANEIIEKIKEKTRQKVEVVIPKSLVQFTKDTEEDTEPKLEEDLYTESFDEYLYQFLAEEDEHASYDYSPQGTQ